MAVEKFEHLKYIDPIPKNISKLLVWNIWDEHLLPLSVHFEWIKAHSNNKEVISAVNGILLKIDNIVNLWKTRFSWEIMSAAADDYKNKKAA